MNPLAAKTDILRQLQQDILSLQGYRAHSGGRPVDTGLKAIEHAFPGAVFPRGVIHEFVSQAPEEAAATSGFMAGLMSCFLDTHGACLWIGTGRRVFPPALKAFGIAPDRIIFVDLVRDKEALWAIEEALKCERLAAVVGELSEIGLTESRRLQLAVEQSRVTGFIHRCRPRKANTTASVSRWRISPLPSAPEEGLPGVGFPRWQVRLEKVRNGKPGTWPIEWTADGFRMIPAWTATVSKSLILKTGTYA